MTLHQIRETYGLKITGLSATFYRFDRVGTDRSIVQMEMRLLDTFAMVALRVGQTEKSLLQKGTGIG